MFLLRKRRPDCPHIGDVPLTFDTLTKHLLVLGASGSGKSYTLYKLLRDLIVRGAPLAICCAKLNEAETIHRLCVDAGAGDRFHRVGMGSDLRINLAHYLLTMTGGSPQMLTRFLIRLNQLATRAGGNEDQAFWATLFEESLMAAIALPQLARLPVSLRHVYDVLATSPDTIERAASNEFLYGTECGRILSLAHTNHHPATEERRYLYAYDYIMKRLTTVGDRARGAVLAMNSGLLNRLLMDFEDLFCTDTNFSPAQAEAERWVLVFDFPTLVYETAGRVAQAALTMLFQMHALRRPKPDVPLCLLRDECSQFLIPEYDWQVQTVARSHGLAIINAAQDFAVLKSGLGGELKAEAEMQAFVANHHTLVSFKNTEMSTCQYVSNLIGQERTFMGGYQPDRPTPQPQSLDDVLGASNNISMNEQYQAIVRPEFLAQLQTGQCYLISGGAWRFLDLRD